MASRKISLNLTEGGDAALHLLQEAREANATDVINWALKLAVKLQNCSEIIVRETPEDPPMKIVIV